MPDPDDTGGNTPAETPPLTFADVHAAEASPAPDSPSSDSPTTLAAAQPGAEQVSPQSPDDRSPYIPRARFDDVNTRLKAAEEWKQKFGWAESIDQQTLTDAVNFYGQYQGDPVEYIQKLIADVQAHPEHGAKLRSIAARALAQGRGQQTQPQTPAPIPIITLEDGSQVDLNALKTQWLQEAQQQLAPGLQELQAERQQREAKAEATSFATDFLADVRKLPGFTTHEAAIKKDLTALIKSGKVGDHPAELRDAVRSLFITHALPAQEASAQSRQLDDLQRKAAASTGINPGSAAPTSPRRPTSFSDPSLKWT